MNFSLSVLNRCDILGVNTALLTSVYLVSAFWVFSLNPPPFINVDMLKFKCLMFPGALDF